MRWKLNKESSQNIVQFFIVLGIAWIAFITLARIASEFGLN